MHLILVVEAKSKHVKPQIHTQDTVISYMNPVRCESTQLHAVNQDTVPGKERKKKTFVFQQSLTQFEVAGYRNSHCCFGETQFSKPPPPQTSPPLALSLYTDSLPEPLTSWHIVCSSLAMKQQPSNATLTASRYHTTKL